MKFFLPCAKGLEYLLADELAALGAEKSTAARAGANADGEDEFIYRALLHSRLASRVLWPLAEFACPDEAALYAAAGEIDWQQHLDPEGTLAIDANVSGTGITHARFAALRVKDAIVDQIRERCGTRPSVDVDEPDLRINLAVRKGRGVLSVDLGSGSLHRRGWRREQGEAPLKETLAAAVLLRGGWPAIAREDGALLDPMCGSGTLLIEGALMAADVAPGLARHANSPPTRWKGFDTDLWQRLREEAEVRAKDGLAALKPVFYGSDLDPHAIRAASHNAMAAGLGDLIHFDRCDIAQLRTPPVPNGLVVCNPPYDARLAADPALYRSIGKALMNAVPDWSAALLCGDRELAHATGLRAEKSYPMFNGALECSLIICRPIKPPQREARPPQPLSEGAQMVANRLRKNLRNLKNWREREGVTCYRAYDADLPEYSAAIDVYVEDGGESRTFLHIQEYEAPKEIPEADTRRRLGELVRAATEVFALPREQIAIKTRSRGRGGEKYGRMDTRGEFVTVREGAAQLRVNLFDYLDTGLFLDHRPMRLRLARDAKDKRFLNLFGYTGAATAHAALGGAASTTTVDLSGTYLEWCTQNLALNGFAGGQHRMVQADVMAWLQAERTQYDLIFCDPPTFSNSARAQDFDVQKDQLRLLRLAVSRLAPGGLLIFSNNFRRFRLDEQGVAEFAEIREISRDTIPTDFARDAKIHRCWELRALA